MMNLNKTVNHIEGKDMFSLHVVPADVEGDDPLKLPGGRIPCMGTFPFHVLHSGVQWDTQWKAPDSHIPCMATSLLHVLLVGVEKDYFCELPWDQTPYMDIWFFSLRLEPALIFSIWID